jgi:uncharacterized membrane protein
VSYAAITLCVASQRVFIVVYFIIDSIRKLLDTPSYRDVCPAVDQLKLSSFLSVHSVHMSRIFLFGVYLKRRAGVRRRYRSKHFGRVL